MAVRFVDMQVTPSGPVAGMNSMSPGLTEGQRAMLRSYEQGAGAQLQPYGATNLNSTTNMYRQALGAAPLTQRTGMGMSPGAGSGGRVMPQPVGSPATLRTAGPMPPQSRMMQRSQQPGQMTANTVAGSPQPGNFRYRGIGPKGNSVFRDPTTGEIFTMPEGASEGMEMGGMYALPSAQPKTGLIGSEEALAQGLDGAMGYLEQGQAQGRSDLMAGGRSANQTLNPYYDRGFRSNDYQAALAGAMGPEAQAQAYANFMESPGQQYLRDQSERAITRNAAATGGTQGGNVLRALQENAIGLAAQDFDNAFNRLGTLSNRGLQAGGQMANNLMSTGQNLAQLGQYGTGLGTNMIYGTGQNLAQGRTRAGERLADNIERTTGNLSNLIYGTGRDVSNVTGQGSNALAQLLASAGRDNQAAMQAYATLLANLSQGTGSQVSGLPSLGGTGQNPGALGGVGDLLSGIGGIMMASDVRLKSNIKPLGRLGDVNLYSWDWNAEGRRVAGGQPTVGVIAQEHPGASVEYSDGYLRVDYSRIFDGD